MLENGYAKQDIINAYKIFAPEFRIIQEMELFSKDEFVYDWTYFDFIKNIVEKYKTGSVISSVDTASDVFNGITVKVKDVEKEVKKGANHCCKSSPQT